MHRTSLLPAAVIAVVLGAALFLHHRHYQRALDEFEHRSTDASYAIRARQNAYMTELKRNFNQLSATQRDLQQAAALLDRLASSVSEADPDEHGLQRRRALIREARAFADRVKPAAEK